MGAPQGDSLSGGPRTHSWVIFRAERAGLCVPWGVTFPVQAVLSQALQRGRHTRVSSAALWSLCPLCVKEARAFCFLISWPWPGPSPRRVGRWRQVRAQAQGLATRWPGQFPPVRAAPELSCRNHGVPLLRRNRGVASFLPTKADV